MRQRAPEGGSVSRLWKAAQVVGVVVTVGFLVGFVVVPEASLNVLWNMAIPLLPLTFLVNAALWRNLCPLATLNMTGNRLGARRRLSNGMIPAAGALGIVLLVVMVPARRFLFNSDGVAMAATVGLIAVAAFTLGALFDAKAGFCNSLCPVLPVERLYGQNPLLAMRNHRCLPCTACTTRACIDLGPRQSVFQTLGSSAHSHRWLRTGFGAFAATFPGFVLGYYTVEDAPWTAAGNVYVHVALWALASYVLAALAVKTLGLTARVAVPVLGGAAVGIYYWFATPVLIEAYGITAAAISPIRVAFAAVVTLWLWRALAAASERPIAARHPADPHRHGSTASRRGARTT